MDVKKAVEIAKNYVVDLFGVEQIRNLGLEEVDYDDQKGAWFITIGFARPWEQSGFLARTGLAEPRSYKVIRISDQDGHVISVKDRRPTIAA